MTEFTREEINNIINLRGWNKEQIDIFNLHGLLFLGNLKDGEYDLNERYTKFSQHYLPILYEDFEDCETEDDVIDTFGELLLEVVNDKLL